MEKMNINRYEELVEAIKKGLNLNDFFAETAAKEIISSMAGELKEFFKEEN